MKIVYNKNINKEILLQKNIVVEDNAKIEEGVLLGCGVCVMGNSIIKAGCDIGDNTVIENSILNEGVKVLSSYVLDSEIGERTTIGPFANVKNKSHIGGDCRIGNFVEIKNSKIGNKTKIAHLTYVGDAEIGEGCNLGCGVIFCNYNGKIKQQIIVGNEVFIGSNVNLIAPLKIDDGAYIAAGSTINKNVEKNNFAIARSYQTNKENFNNPHKKL